MKKIVVATDFSACAGNAMEYAMELAKVLNAEICALHAIGSLEGVFNNTYNALYIEDYHNNKRAALAAWAKTYSEREGWTGVPVSTYCEVGSLTSIVAKYITANPVELLVMGTMGSSGITGIFGSTASSVVEKTRIPTLIVPLEGRFATEPAITLATDFSTELSAEDVTALNELILAFRTGKLNVVNVVEGPEWKTNETGEAGLRKVIAPATTIDFHYIKENSPIEGIINFIVSSSTDILCVVKRHHNIIYRIFNTSTVNKVMGKTIRAILVLHE